MSKIGHLFVFLSLEYCAEKRLLKTHVAFFMKVTVTVPKPKWKAKPTMEKWILDRHKLRQTFPVGFVIYLRPSNFRQPGK
jgi:hypothetical protein